jgi:hypothetical protein
LRENSSSDLTTTASNRRLFEIPRGHRIRSILVKAGVINTAVSAGNTAYTTVSDTILDDVKIFAGINKQVRHYTDYFVAQEEAAMAYGLAPSSGYALLDFARHGAHGEAFDSRGMIAGPTGDTDFFLQGDVTGAANQRAVFMVEELRGGPGSVSR